MKRNEEKPGNDDRFNKQQRRRKLIDFWTKSQFQPLAFSIESNPLVGAFMRPYIDLLRKHTQITAYFFWEMDQQGVTDTYWLADKYVGSLGVWAEALSFSAETSFNESFRMLSEAVPPQKYFDIVGKLAQEMGRNAGHPSSQALDFWLSAENYMLKIATRAIANAKTVSEAIDSLGRMFAGDSLGRMFAGIRKTASYIWETLGEPRGHSMDDWLQAEAQALTLWR